MSSMVLIREATATATHPAVTVHAGFRPTGFANTCLSRDQIAGPFSVAGDQDIYIALERGAVVRVRSGHVEASRDIAERSRKLTAGRPYIAMRDEVLRLQVSHYAQLEVTWPPAHAVGRA
jgi:hypothetical protein